MYGIFIHPTYRLLETWLWVGLYDFLGHFSAQEVCYIGPRAPILCEGHTWEIWWQKNNSTFHNGFGSEVSPNWHSPNIDNIKKIPSHFLEISFFNELIQELKTPDAVFEYIRHDPYNKLTEVLTRELKRFKDNHHLKIIFSFWPCPSLIEACRNVNIACMFLDFSAIRPPRSISLHFFDPAGVHANSNFLPRYAAFKKNHQNSFPVLSKQQLVDLLVNEEYKPLFFKEDSNEYDIGVALPPSHYLGRISGRKQPVSSEEFVLLVAENYSGKKILVRNYPASSLYLQCKNMSNNFLPFNNIYDDTSNNSIEFIKKCKEIFVIHGNLALESILCDKETHVLSDNVHKYFSRQSITKTQHQYAALEMLNYFIFGYLIPSEFKYDKEYIQWRLGGPSESDIYKRHYEYIVNLRKRCNPLT